MAWQRLLFFKMADLAVSGLNCFRPAPMLCTKIQKPKAIQPKAIEMGASCLSDTMMWSRK